MKTLDRYITAELLKSFVIIAFTVISLFVIFDFSLNAGKFSRAAVGFGEIAGFYAIYIPSLLSNSLPMVLLLSLFWSMNRLNKNREIIAMQASGISVFRICLPLLIGGLILATADYFIEEEINTKNARTINRFMERIKGQNNKDTIEKQYFFTDANSSLLWFPKFDNSLARMDGQITWDYYGIGDVPIMRIFAGSGEYLSDSWWLYDVKVISFKDGKEIIVPHKLKRRLMHEWDFRPAELQRSKDFSELRVSRLQKRIARYKQIQPEMARNMSLELHNRFALPLMNVVALLLSIPFAFRIRGAQSIIGGVGISLVLVFIYYGVYTTSIILGKHGFLSPFIVWVPNLIFSAIGVILFRIHRI